jgi:hypothetical protein
MAGLGFGLMYLPAMDIIEVYFDRQENPIVTSAGFAA